MSKRSQREKRSRDRAGSDVPPLENDWVYACPKGMGTREIAAALGVAGQPVTEVPAQTWQQDWQMANAFMDAYDYPEGWRWHPGEPVGLNLLMEWMRVKSSQFERPASGRVASVRFLGELIIVRRSWEAAESTLALLLNVVQANVDWSRKKFHPQARIVLVLEGWERPAIAGKIGKRVAWTVNPLPPPPSF